MKLQAYIIGNGEVKNIQKGLIEAGFDASKIQHIPIPHDNAGSFLRTIQDKIADSDLIYFKAGHPEDVNAGFKYLKNMPCGFIIEMQKKIQSSYLVTLEGKHFRLPEKNKRYFLVGNFQAFQLQNTRLEYCSEGNETPFQYVQYLSASFLYQLEKKIRRQISYKDYEAMIFKVAMNYAKKLNKNYNELLSDAYFGFEDAKRKYNPLKGWKFSTYAWMRIAGAILDGQRANKDVFKKEVKMVNGVKIVQKNYIEYLEDLSKPEDEQENSGSANYDYEAFKSSQTSMSDQIKDIVHDLPEEERVLYEARYVCAKNYNELARTLGITRAKVAIKVAEFENKVKKLIMGGSVEFGCN